MEVVDVVVGLNTVLAQIKSKGPLGYESYPNDGALAALVTDYTFVLGHFTPICFQVLE